MTAMRFSRPRGRSRLTRPIRPPYNGRVMSPAAVRNWAGLLVVGLVLTSLPARV